MNYATLVIIAKWLPNPLQVAVPRTVADDIVQQFTNGTLSKERIGKFNVVCREDTLTWAVRTDEIVGMFVSDAVLPVNPRPQPQFGSNEFAGWRS